jgi:hypothetical protein
VARIGQISPEIHHKSNNYQYINLFSMGIVLRLETSRKKSPRLTGTGAEIRRFDLA